MRISLLSIAGAGLVLALGATLIASRLNAGPALEELDITRAPVHSEDAGAGLCPWRSPDADRKHFFPDATEVQDETIVLSRQRGEIARRLGHAPSGADNALRIHRVLQHGKTIGAIITRSVRGESGVIELVLAIDPIGSIVGAKLQRLREPDDVGCALQSPAWLDAFRGKTARSEWRLGQDIPAVEAPARASAAAIIDGARTALILLDVGDWR